MAFDYIVIGAGSTGCVVANRLSEQADCRVLLIESGDEARNRFTDIPGAAPHLQDTNLDWAFKTEPQRQLNDRRIPYPRGRAVGGTSILNYMVYVRGNKGDYDHWAQLGNTGWDYDSVLPYFRKAESNRTFADDFHGQDGPLTVETLSSPHPLYEVYLEAAQSVGIPLNADFNGQVQEGCGYFQQTTNAGKRWSTARAYIDPIHRRSNFTLEKNALVLNLVIEKGRVCGVDYLREGKEVIRAHADRETICCAGAIGSPQILMLSGIGSGEELRDHGIEVVLDLPGVGRGLQDHLGGMPIVRQLKEPERYELGRKSFEENIREFEEKGMGALTSMHLDVGGFLRAAPGDAYPKLQMVFTPGIGERYRHLPGQGNVYFGGYVCKPASRGTVRIASANPLDRPLIDPDYLSDPGDMDLSVEFLKRNLEIARSPVFEEISEPGTSPTLGTRESYENFIRANASTIWHPTSTCRMGQDRMAVVDSQLRVHGVDSLRVADASIMPDVISGNTNAPAIMIGEKAADLIVS